MSKRKIITWTGLVLCGGISIAANIYSVFIPHLPEGWTGAGFDLAGWHSGEKPKVDPSSLVRAVLMPVLAVLAVELIAAADNLSRYFRYGVLIIAAAVALLSSFVHIVTVAIWSGEVWWIAILYPFAIDSIMALCAKVIIDGSGHVSTDKTAPRTLDTVRVPAPALSPVPLGPVVPAPVVPDAVPMSPEPVVPMSVQDKPARVPTQRKGTWNREEAIRLIVSGEKDNALIGEKVGTGYKTIQRLRKKIQDGEIDVTAVER